ncbi:putative F-box protein At1g67623 [Malus sylvestris]|uniref:putative F-box protein At1g67623 n=1 Tax=Malus sylvestris TaxID=3752 RepID=UPI0021AC22DB|nr:putative F-box protein At1g67623 [Malus sylvestris]
MVRSFVLISGIVNGTSHKIKKKKKPRNASLSIQSLPNEVLVQVLARVASRSFDDLYSAKLSCKNFNESAQDDHIFEHVDISKFPLVSWRASEKRTRFLKRCRDLGNAEALYRQGMCDLFTSKRIEPAGIESLKRAASKGHVEATYVYGAILVCCGGDSRQKGLELLYSLNCHKSRGLSVTECREKIKELIWNTMWVNREVIGRIVEAHDENAAMKACNDCGDPQGPYTIKQGWDFDDHNKFSNCNSCRWHQEVNIFCDILSCRHTNYD